MIRVASLKDMVHVNYTKKDIAGMTPGEQLLAISKKTHELVHEQYDVYGKLISKLADNGIHLISHYEDLDDKQERYVNEYFRSEVYPVLTPMAVDSARPFPLIQNKSLNIGAILKFKPSNKKTAMVNSVNFMYHITKKSWRQCK